MNKSISLIGLNDLELKAYDKIKNIIASSDLPAHDLVLGKTIKYLTVSSDGAYPFCNFKMSGNLYYIALCIGDHDEIANLVTNPVYRNLKDSSKKFTRFEIVEVDDIEKYAEGIVSACRWINPTFRQRKLATLDRVGLSPDLKQFFSNMEALLTSSRKYKIIDDEIVFFQAYIDKLSASGLNWQNILPSRSSDGTICVCGGYVKLQGRKTKMAYRKHGATLVSFAENLPLSAYIELQKYWIADCLEDKDYYFL